MVGKYIEYYIDPNNEKAQLKMKGKYKLVEKEVAVFDSRTYLEKIVTQLIPTKIGRWKYYKANGQLEKVEKL